MVHRVHTDQLFGEDKLQLIPQIYINLLTKVSRVEEFSFLSVSYVSQELTIR